MRIERIDPSQAMRFKAVRLKSLEESPDAFGSTLKTAVEWEDKVWTTQVQKLTTYIASLEETDVGTARVVKDENDPDVAWIISMWVSPEAREKKIAVALLKEIISWAIAEDVAELKLDVVDTNTQAIKLYEGHGFKPNGVTSCFPEPREHITQHQRVLTL